MTCSGSTFILFFLLAIIRYQFHCPSHPSRIMVHRLITRRCRCLGSQFEITKNKELRTRIQERFVIYSQRETFLFSCSEVNEIKFLLISASKYIERTSNRDDSPIRMSRGLARGIGEWQAVMNEPKINPINPANLL